MVNLEKAGISRIDTRFVCMLPINQQKMLREYIDRNLKKEGVYSPGSVNDAISSRVVDLFD